MRMSKRQRVKHTEYQTDNVLVSVVFFLRNECKCFNRYWGSYRKPEQQQTNGFNCLILTGSRYGLEQELGVQRIYQAQHIW